MTRTHKARRALIAVVREGVPIMQAYLKEYGGCDHAVNICACGLVGWLERADAALKLARVKVKP